MEDFEVWANKRPAIEIMQVPTDGPFGKSRTWYKQFYNPRARAAEIVARVQGLHRVKGCPTRAEYAAQ
jgi:3-ketosteroid 9alpha-monooxygenase subunit A